MHANGMPIIEDETLLDDAGSPNAVVTDDAGTQYSPINIKTLLKVAETQI